MKRVLLIENSSLDFFSARSALAIYLIQKGWEVYALIPNDEHVQKIRDLGIHVIVKELDRSNKGIIQLLRLIKTYRQIIRRYDIDIIHSFRFQPNLVNTLANFFNTKRVIIHITGLGIAFSNKSLKYLLFRLVSHLIFQFKLFRADRVIVQNEEDGNDMWFYRFWKDKISVINGSGINTSVFNNELYNKSQLRSSLGINQQNTVFICISRLIWEKGIREMVTAFELVARSNNHIKLIIVGWSDEDNPRHVDNLFIERYKNHSSVAFLGRKSNVKELLAASDVFLYPSYYREGIPRGILEALSMSLPIITTNTPGCNLTVVPGENGYLIPPRSTQHIGEAIGNILNDDLASMGLRSRLLAKSKFSDQIVFSSIEELYH